MELASEKSLDNTSRKQSSDNIGPFYEIPSTPDYNKNGN